MNKFFIFGLLLIAALLVSAHDNDSSGKKKHREKRNLSSFPLDSTEVEFFKKSGSLDKQSPNPWQKGPGKNLMFSGWGKRSPSWGKRSNGWGKRSWAMVKRHIGHMLENYRGLKRNRIFNRFGKRTQTLFDYDDILHDPNPEQTSSVNPNTENGVLEDLYLKRSNGHYGMLGKRDDYGYWDKRGKNWSNHPLANMGWKRFMPTEGKKDDYGFWEKRGNNHPLANMGWKRTWRSIPIAWLKDNKRDDYGFWDKRGYNHPLANMGWKRMWHSTPLDDKRDDYGFWEKRGKNWSNHPLANMGWKRFMPTEGKKDDYGFWAKRANRPLLRQRK